MQLRLVRSQPSFLPVSLTTRHQTLNVHELNVHERLTQRLPVEFELHDINLPWHVQFERGHDEVYSLDYFDWTKIDGDINRQS